MRSLRKERASIGKTRVWEVDALRGLLILCMLGYHLYMTVDAFCINGYYNIDPINYINATDPLRFWFTISPFGEILPGAFPAFSIQYLQPLSVDTFFIISGICCVFSRNNLKSGIRLLCGAAFVSVFTALLVLYTGDEIQFIRFGVLHCYAVCHLIHYYFLEDRKDRTLLLVSGVSLILGYYLRAKMIHTDFALLVPFGFYENDTVMRDYWPVFPMLGWFLIGVVLGRHLYTEKKTRFPELNDQRWHRPLQFLGRHSGLIYCGHMVVYTIVFCGVGHIFSLY